MERDVYEIICRKDIELFVPPEAYKRGNVKMEQKYKHGAILMWPGMISRPATLESLRLYNAGRLPCFHDFLKELEEIEDRFIQEE